MPPDESTPNFEAFGFKIPLPKWAVSVLAAVVILGVAVAIYQKVYSDPVRQVLTLKEVNDQLASDVEEYGKHAMEEPTKHELFTDADGALALRVYADHCVLIQRTTREGTVTRLVQDLAKHPSPRKKATAQIDPPGSTWMLGLQAAPPCKGGCLNPHPGAFKWWYGQMRQDGWVQVFRQWPEGCQHFQMFHAPTGTWATNRDGSPAVTWICCVH